MDSNIFLNHNHDLLFEFLPLPNKFRSIHVTMCGCIQVGEKMLVAKRLIKRKSLKKKEKGEKEKEKKKGKILEKEKEKIE